MTGVTCHAQSQGDAEERVLRSFARSASQSDRTKALAHSAIYDASFSAAEVTLVDTCGAFGHRLDSGCVVESTVSLPKCASSMHDSDPFADQVLGASCHACICVPARPRCWV